VHQHVQGVLNLLLLGKKKWMLEHPRIKGFTFEVTQLSGNLLWLPPGWFHSARTVNENDRGLESVTCSDGRTSDFAISLPIFHTPKHLREWAIAKGQLGQ
jgi:hypothetical protein